MPRNGTGTYTAPANSWNPPVNGANATSADWAATQADYVAALSQSVSSDGQTPMTGNLPLGGNKITGLAAGTANTDAVNLSQVNSNAGQCRLVKSGANLLLQPYQGNRLTINGVVYSIPSAGVSLAPTSAVANTLYYIYAYMNSGVMTLEFSTTGHSTDTTTGVEIKTGDATRTLVGMARPTAGPVWVDSATQRFVISWFNRRRANMYLQSSGALSTALGTPQALLSVSFLTWNDENLTFGTNGTQSNNTVNSVNGSSLGVDSTSAAFVPTNRQAFAASAAMAAVASYSLGTLSEGFHTVNALGWVVSGGGTASWAAPNGFELTGSVVV